MAASAPVNLHSNFSKCEYRSPLLPASRLYSRFEYPLTISAALIICPKLIGARPRFVCRMVPVPLITFFIFGVCIADTAFAIFSFRRAICCFAFSSSSHTPINARSFSISLWIASMTLSRLYVSINTFIPSSARRISTFGILRYNKFLFIILLHSVILFKF